jgi:hypothetical protein
LKLRSAFARVSATALALGLLVVITVLALFDAPTSTVAGSVHNTEDDGRRALFLVLGGLGLEPEVWSGVPADLPAGRHALWWAAAPIEIGPDILDEYEIEADEPPEARSETEPYAPREPDALDLARESGPRAARHLRRFLSQGGRLVVGLDEDLRAHLEYAVGLREFADTRVEEFTPAEGPVRLASGETLELDIPQARRLVGLDSALPREVLATDANGEALVLELPVGRGGVVLLAHPELFDNGALREGDGALLAVRLAEELAPGGRLLFDESNLGLGAARGVGALLWSVDLRLASLHALLVGLLCLWFLTWAREFPRDPQRHDLVAPLERARAAAGLAVRAGRIGVLADQLRRGTLRRAAQRLRAPYSDELSAARNLAALTASLGERFEDDRWQNALVDSQIQDLDELARLDAQLRALEAELVTPATSLSHA